MRFDAQILKDGYTRPDDEEGEEVEDQDQFVKQEKNSAFPSAETKPARKLCAASALKQFDVGKCNYGFIAGPGGYIVTENDFCHQVRPLNEPTELRDTWTLNGEQGYQRVSLAEMQSRAAPIASYRGWAHYWGIKDRIAFNYREFLKSMREIGLSTNEMPKFGDEPLTAKPDTSARNGDNNRSQHSPASLPKTPFSLPLTSRKSDNGEFYVLDSENQTIARFSLQKDAEWFVEATQDMD